MTLPPRPTTPQFLRMLNLIFRPVDYLDNYGKQFGDFFAVGKSETPFVYVNHPEAIQQIFTIHRDKFKSGQGNGILRVLLGENSVVLLDGDAHQQQRKLLMPPFHGEKLQAYPQLIADITQTHTQSWTAGQVIPLRSAMQQITLSVILRLVFGLSKGDRYHQLTQLLTRLLEGTGSPLSSTMLFFSFLRQDWGKWSPWGRFLWLKAQIDHLLLAEISDRRNHLDPDADDILSQLLLARDEEGNLLSDAEIRDELMTLLVAGHETTASALTWALYWIHFLPEVEDKLRFSLSGLGENASAQQMARIPYLEAVCQETLRIYPVAIMTFPRIVQTPVDLMGYHFPSGCVLVPCIYLVHHREDLYPNSKQFKPERFLKRQFSPYEFFPFGGGSRRCIGMALALLEMKVVIATLLSEFNLRLLNPRVLKPTRRGLTLAPPNRLKLRVL